jgi:hypothetical protein
VSDDHFSLDELAELDEGLLDPERTSAVRAHLHGCGECRDRTQALATTRSILADLPPVAMPAQVSARLDQALGDEAAERAGAAGPSDPDAAAPEAAHPSDVVPAPGTVARRRIGRPTLPAIAVAAALVLAVGAIVVGAVNHNNGGSDESAGASGSLTGSAQGTSGSSGIIAPAQPANFVQTSTGQSYTAGTLINDVQGLIVHEPGKSPDFSSVPSASAGNAIGSPASGDRPAVRKHKHGANTSAPNVRSAPSAQSALTNQPVARVLQPLASSRSKILACAARLTGTKNAVPLAVDFGTWTNPQNGARSPAAIFVFKAADPSKLAVFISAPACDGTFEQFDYVPLPG